MPAARSQSPSWRHWLGTDLYGRDQLSRIIYAARVDLVVAFAATATALVIGALIGAIAGYRGGWVDQLVMRMVEAVLAFPALVLAMGIARGARQQRSATSWSCSRSPRSRSTSA